MPDALIGLAGPYDIRQFADAADALFAAPIDEAPAEWDAANPVVHADLRPEVPVLLLHGEADDVVPVSFTTDFGTALRGRRPPDDGPHPRRRGPRDRLRGRDGGPTRRRLARELP